MTGRVRLLLLSTLLLWAQGSAAAVPAGYRLVAEAEGVPASVLYAVALAESGVTMESGGRRPWPWSLNVEGRAHRYATRADAWRALRGFLSRGVTRVDVGPMQVSWLYHREALGDAWSALDPYHNLRVGAAILRAEHRRTGDWWRAVGRYHSPNNAKRASRYRSRVATWYRRIAGERRPG